MYLACTSQHICYRDVVTLLVATPLFRCPAFLILGRVGEEKQIHITNKCLQMSSAGYEVAIEGSRRGRGGDKRTGTSSV